MQRKSWKLVPRPPVKSRIHSKSKDIQACTSKCPFLCSPVSQDRFRVPRDAKVEALSKPNNKFGHHKSAICLQNCQEDTILQQWAMVGSPWQRAQPIRYYVKTELLEKYLHWKSLNLDLSKCPYHVCWKILIAYGSRSGIRWTVNHLLAPIFFVLNIFMPRIDTLPDGDISGEICEKMNVYNYSWIHELQ